MKKKTIKIIKKLILPPNFIVKDGAVYVFVGELPITIEALNKILK